MSSTWKLNHRKGLHVHLNNNFSKWSDVVFVESPFSLLVHTFLKFKSRVIERMRKENKVSIVKTFMPITIFHNKIWNKFPFTIKIDVLLLSIQIRSFIKKNYTGKKLIIWSANPFDYPFLEKLNPDFTVYDFYDNFSFDENGSYNPWKDSFNKKVIIKSNLVFCTGIKLFEFAKPLNSETHYLPNGHNFFFSGVTEKVDLKINGRIIGYLGNIRDWIDFTLVKELALRLSDEEYLVFIGPIERNVLKEIKSLKNIRQFKHIDAVKYEQVYSYIKNFDIGIIPFKTNRFMNGVFPNKFFEYVSCGIKIVTTNLPDMKQYKEVINVAENYDEFINMCLSKNYKLNFDVEIYNKIKSESSWDLRADFINEKAKEMLSGKKNIITIIK